MSIFILLSVLFSIQGLSFGFLVESEYHKGITDKRCGICANLIPYQKLIQECFVYGKVAGLPLGLFDPHESQQNVQFVNEQLTLRQETSSPGMRRTETYEFPWLVVISLQNRGFCGGALFNENWLITTGQCCDTIEKVQPSFHIGFKRQTHKGDTIIQNDENIKCFKHPEFGSSNGKNDIALVKLTHPTRKIKFDYQTYAPVCLPKTKKPRKRDTSTDQVLMLGFDDGYKFYKFDLKIQKQTESLIETGSSAQPGKEKSYNGSLLIQFSLEGRAVLLGSLSKKSQNTNVFVRISQYVDWVINTVKSN